MKKIILDLCGGTGSWSKPYKEAGYDVRVITLPEYDITWTTFLPDYIEFNGTGHQMLIPLEEVYGVLAAPPCTMFSIARTTALTPRDLEKGMETVEKCMEIIWHIRKTHKLTFWALENPRGLLRQFLGKPALTFQPNEFGDMHTKNTDIWGYFKMPTKLKNPVVIPDRIRMSLAKNNRILPTLPEGYTAHKFTGERSQAARRAMTPPGFATAFFKANQ